MSFNHCFCELKNIGKINLREQKRANFNKEKSTCSSKVVHNNAYIPVSYAT